MSSSWSFEIRIERVLHGFSFMEFDVLLYMLAAAVMIFFVLYM